MSNWPASNARRVLAALERIGWREAQSLISSAADPAGLARLRVYVPRSGGDRPADVGEGGQADRVETRRPLIPYATQLLGRRRLDRGFLDGFDDLFDNTRVKRRVAMERNHHPAFALRVDPMTALGPQPNEASFQQHPSAAVKRGSLAMNFDRGGQNLLAQRRRALFIGQGLQEEFNCLATPGNAAPSGRTGKYDGTASESCDLVLHYHRRLWHAYVVKPQEIVHA